MHHIGSRTAAHALRLLVMSTLVLSFTVLAPPQHAAAAGALDDHTVLILGPTVSGGALSREALAAAAIGMTIEVVDNIGWAAKSQADFATYRALILGDRTCTSLGAAAAAIANTMVWGPTVNGRVVIIGSDPVFHSGSGGAAFTTGAVQFVAGETTRTGAYITLSCYYHGVVEHTPVPLLDGFALGGFTVRGVGCFNNAHIVASSPALTGITDATLSNWSCSVHEAFDLWPITTFDVLAIARGIGTTFVASDGSVGTPYILARGVSVISDITLAPLAGTAATGTTYTFTATVHEGGTPTAGRVVTFNAIGGPNNGMTLTGSAPTNASGQATASYSSALEGTDTWVAHFTDSALHVQTSNRATVEWTKPTVTLHSLALDGATGYAEAPNAAKLNLTGNWTVEAWFKDEHPAGFNHLPKYIVGKSDSNVDPEAPYFIAVGWNYLQAGVRTGWVSSVVVAKLGGLDPTKWHHVAVTGDAATRTLSIYLDGAFAKSGTVPAFSAGNSLPLSIGRNGSSGAKWHGKIDDLRIWNTVRSASEISANFSSEFSSAPAGLVGNWKFDEASGTTAADNTASPDDATLHGAASFSTDVHP